MNFRQVHLDFHTSEAISGIGAKFDKKQFQEALKAGHVNSITIFSKCHHGWAYHPSEANEMNPGLDFDLLAAQIEAAHEIGVKTPVYLSAGFDEKAAMKHPEWLYDNKEHTAAGVDSYLNAGYHLMCMNSPYLDYLLAQIKEVVKRYDADGIFLDIVGVRECYCPNCIKTLHAEGHSVGDRTAVLELGERVYANYLRRVRETIDSVKPGLPVFHNGGHIRHGRRDLAVANTHLELESLPTGGWGYDHFPMSARYVQTLGMDYLGMTGKFHLSWGEFGGFKHPNALRYEAALSVANGAKCSVGDQLAPSGEADMATYRLIGAAYKEVEEKEPWLDKVTPVADIALLSNEAIEDSNITETLGGSMAGATRILLEGKYLFNVIDTEEDFCKYKVMILADTISVSEALKEKLNKFLSQGGRLLTSGKSAIDDNGFVFDFGAEWKGESEYNPVYLRPKFEYETVENTDYVIYAEGQKIKLTNGEELAEQIEPYFNRTREHFCSHRHAPSSGKRSGCGMVEGKDGIYIAWDIFAEYSTHGDLIAKRTVCYALDRLLGENASFKTNLPAQGVVTLMEQKEEKRFIAHFLYAAPVKRGNGVEIIEDILPVYNISASICTGHTIRNIYLAPQMKKLSFTQNNGRTEFVIPEFECHQMVVLEY